MKAIQIHGKEYYTVAERLKEFRKRYEYTYSIETEIIGLSEDSVTIRAVIKTLEGVVISDGIAHKEKSWGGVNTKYMIEFCQTSAIGRALAYFGIGVVDDIASADEIGDVDNGPEASFAQISMIESLLNTANITEAESKKIDREYLNFSQDVAGKCISYLKENQANKSLDEQLTDKLK